MLEKSHDITEYYMCWNMLTLLVILKMGMIEIGKNDKSRNSNSVEYVAACGTSAILGIVCV